VSDPNISRRKFLRISGKATKLAITLSLVGVVGGCATFDPNTDWGQIAPEDFNYNDFNSWYKKYKLYNTINRNAGNRQEYTFKRSTFGDMTPGLGYYRGEMIAVAPGFVSNIFTLNTGRMGGEMVNVAHFISSQMTASYMSSYAHLSKVAVQLGQKVKRGDLIGKVGGAYRPKIMLREGGNWVDPDNYGPNHSYMNPYKGAMPIDSWEQGGEKEIEQKRKITREKVLAQYMIINKIDVKRIGWLDDKINKWHNKSSFSPAMWSMIDRFRYLETLYHFQPRLFPEITKDEFEDYRTKFFKNQAIITSLPIVV
jgi:hypothetical protein